MHTVSKDFRFEAGHSLNPRLLGPTHKCCRPHGHSYRVRIFCVAHDLDFRGFVVDYAEIAAAVQPLIDKLDHQFLNDVLPFHTTAENLAQWFHEELIEKLPTLAQVNLYETPTTCCSYIPS